MTLTKDDINEFCEDSMCTYMNKYIKLSRLKENDKSLKKKIEDYSFICSDKETGNHKVILTEEVIRIINEHFGEVLKE